jgi:hypothetical protein
VIFGTTAYDPRENGGDRDEQDQGSQVRVPLLFPLLTMSTLCPLQVTFDTMESRIPLGIVEKPNCNSYQFLPSY